MMALNIGDLSILEGLMEVKKQLYSLGPWVTVLLHPVQEEFVFFLLNVWVFSLILLRGSFYSLHVTCESQLASTGVKQKYTYFSSGF